MDADELAQTDEARVDFGKLTLQPGNLPLHYGGGGGVGGESGEDADDEGGGGRLKFSVKKFVCLKIILAFLPQ